MKCAMLVGIGLWSVMCCFTSINADIGDSCMTPDNLNGTCRSYEECIHLQNLLAEGTRDNINYLQRCQCGNLFIGIIPVVCCPSPPKIDPRTLINADICGISTTDRIYGGKAAQISEFPWMALLSYIDKTSGKIEYRCGGSLINNRYVLTASHCIIDELIGVRLGEHDLRTEIDCEVHPITGKDICAPSPQDFGIETKTIHDHYSFTRKRIINDIALIRLDRPVEFTSAIKPICLPENNAEDNLEDKKLIVAGWGKTENGTNSDVLLKVKVPVVTNSRCSEINAYARSITERTLCAGGTNKAQDSCNGDSGGPLILMIKVGNTAKYVQFGIVSFGIISCGLEGYPGVYTRVSSYRSWILENIEP